MKIFNFIFNALRICHALLFHILFLYFTNYLLVEYKEVVYIGLSAIMNVVMAIAGGFFGFYLFDKFLKLFGYEC